MKEMSYKLLTEMFPFGQHGFVLENIVFSMASAVAHEYRGGQWYVSTTPDGLQLLVPPTPELLYLVRQDSNGYVGTMDAPTLGAALTLLIFNHQLWQYAEQGKSTDKLNDQYYKMLNQVYDTPGLDIGAIAGFLD